MRTNVMFWTLLAMGTAVAFIGVINPANAQMVVTDPPNQEVSWLDGAALNVTSKFASGYVFNDLGAIVTEDGVNQSSFTATAKNGLYGSFWFSQGLAMRSLTKGGTQEWDAYFGWAGSCGRFHCHAQAAYFMEPTLFTGKSDIVRLRVEVSDSYEVGNGSIGWYAGTDWFASFMPPQTVTLRTGVTGSYRLTDRWSFGGVASYAYDTHPHRNTFGYDVGFTRDMSDVAKGLTLSVPHVEGFVPLGYVQKTPVIVSMTLSYDF